MASKLEYDESEINLCSDISERSRNTFLTNLTTIRDNLRDWLLDHIETEFMPTFDQVKLEATVTFDVTEANSRISMWPRAQDPFGDYLINRIREEIDQMTEAEYWSCF